MFRRLWECLAVLTLYRSGERHSDEEEQVRRPICVNSGRPQAECDCEYCRKGSVGRT
jgi:hypothetical protein